MYSIDEKTHQTALVYYFFLKQTNNKEKTNLIPKIWKFCDRMCFECAELLYSELHDESNEAFLFHGTRVSEREGAPEQVRGVDG